MSRQPWLLIGLFSFGLLSSLAMATVSSPAHACTPSPDNPYGCDRINSRLNFPVVGNGGWGGGGDDPWPPNCIVCGKVQLHPQDESIQPVNGLDRKFDVGTFKSLNPQPLPPKAEQGFGF
ncbi:MAG TPA: hypothetical protein V6D19_03065 [Stenomitos sp.]